MKKYQIIKKQLAKFDVARVDAQTLADAVNAGCRAMVKRDDVKEIDAYIEEQQAMFKAKGQPTDRVYKEAIVPTGERTASGTEMFRIVKRDVPLLIDRDADGNVAGLSLMARDASAGKRDYERDDTKYGDAGLLVEQTIASIDREEALSGFSFGDRG